MNKRSHFHLGMIDSSDLCFLVTSAAQPKAPAQTYIDFKLLHQKAVEFFTQPVKKTKSDSVEITSLQRVTSRDQLVKIINDKKINDFSKFDLRDLDLQGVVFPEGSKFGSDLSGVKLNGATLRKSILKGSNLSGADLSGADLSGGSVLDDANLSKANLSKTDLSSASLKGTNLQGATLIETNFTKANLGGAILRDINKNVFTESNPLSFVFNFFGKKAGSSSTDFRFAKLPNVNLRGANLSHADFYEAQLPGADFEGATLDDVKFTLSNLQGASFKNAQLKGEVSFNKANLQGASFRGSDWSYNGDSHSSGVTIQEADIRGADLTQVKVYKGWMKNETVFGTKYNKETLTDRQILGDIDGSRFGANMINSDTPVKEANPEE